MASPQKLKKEKKHSRLAFSSLRRLVSSSSSHSPSSVSGSKADTTMETGRETDKPVHGEVLLEISVTDEQTCVVKVVGARLRTTQWLDAPIVRVRLRDLNKRQNHHKSHRTGAATISEMEVGTGDVQSLLLKWNKSFRWHLSDAEAVALHKGAGARAEASISDEARLQLKCELYDGERFLGWFGFPLVDCGQWSLRWFKLYEESDAEGSRERGTAGDPGDVEKLLGSHVELHVSQASGIGRPATEEDVQQANTVQQANANDTEKYADTKNPVSEPSDAIICADNIVTGPPVTDSDGHGMMPKGWSERALEGRALDGQDASAARKLPSLSPSISQFETGKNPISAVGAQGVVQRVKAVATHLREVWDADTAALFCGKDEDSEYPPLIALVFRHGSALPNHETDREGAEFVKQRLTSAGFIVKEIQRDQADAEPEQSAPPQHVSSRICFALSVAPSTALEWAEQARLRKRVAFSKVVRSLPPEYSIGTEPVDELFTEEDFEDLPIRAEFSRAAALRGWFVTPESVFESDAVRFGSAATDLGIAGRLLSPADLIFLATRRVHEVPGRDGDDARHIVARLARRLQTDNANDIDESDGPLRVAGIKIFPGSGLVTQLIDAGFVDVFALHSDEHRAQLLDHWVRPGFRQESVSDTLNGDKLSPVHERVDPRVVPEALARGAPVSSLVGLWRTFSSTRQPLDMVRGYFGSAICMYFAWLEHYTVMLLWPTIFGLFIVISRPFRSTDNWTDPLTPLYCLMLSLWTTVLCETWKRRESHLAMSWGVHDLTPERELPRPGFKGMWRLNPLTRQAEFVDVDSPRLKFWKMMVTAPVVLFMVGAAASVMFFYFWINDHTSDLLPARWEGLIHAMMVLFYSALIPGFSMIYRKVAISLTNWENHRIQSEYSRSLVIKILLFEAFNNYGLLFYVAFWKQDFELLRDLLFGILFTRQISGQVLEAIVPWYMTKAKLIWKSRARADSVASLDVVDAAFVMEPYELFEDYLEMIVQLGFVTFFASAFPLAPLFALVNNLTEIRSDAFKLLEVHRRPRCEQARDIGIWMQVMEVVSVVGIVTNLVIIGQTSPLFRDAFPDAVTRIFLLVFLEHVLIGARAAIAVVIPDVPRHVHESLEKISFAEACVRANLPAVGKTE